mmetsp:Transcript_4028/g.11395  ORF Transcript_4028/g.11395 Transcript_4028/m.11395 type:complete len:216 (+) Transcript_4028:5144-5791(+)
MLEEFDRVGMPAPVQVLFLERHAVQVIVSGKIHQFQHVPFGCETEHFVSQHGSLKDACGDLAAPSVQRDRVHGNVLHSSEEEEIRILSNNEGGLVVSRLLRQIEIGFFVACQHLDTGRSQGMPDLRSRQSCTRQFALPAGTQARLAAMTARHRPGLAILLQRAPLLVHLASSLFHGGILLRSAHRAIPYNLELNAAVVAQGLDVFLDDLVHERKR